VDKNGDGVISRIEMKNSLAFISINTDDFDFEEIFNECDVDHNGIVDYHEFITATWDRKKLLTNEKLTIAFTLFDQDGSGKISLAELRAIMEGNATDQE
jgi:calcium-dependent protein kinase